MAVTVPFLFEVSRSKNFDRILNEVVGGIGKLSDEAKKASEKIDDLVGGKFKNVPLTSMFRDLNEAINSGDIDNINSKLEETGRILSSLEMKVDDTALKNLEKLTQTQVDEILKSVTKKGSNSAVIKKMINDRATKNASGGGSEKDLSEYKKYLVTAEEARKKLKELQVADVIKKEDVNGIKDFVGYYERLVQLNEKITDNTITDDISFIMGNFDKDNKYSFAGNASGKKKSVLNLSELQEIQSGVKQISQVEGMVNEGVSVSADGMGEAAQEIKNAAASLKEAASDLKGSAQSIQDSANSLSDFSGKMQGTSELSAEQAEAIRNIISAIGQQGDAVSKVQKQEEQVNNQLDEQLEKEKKINEEKQKIKKQQQDLYKNRDQIEIQLENDKDVVNRLKEVLEYEPKKYTTHQDVQNTLEALSAVINTPKVSRLRRQAAMVDYTKSLQDVRKTKFRTPFPKNVLKEFENVGYNLSPDELKEMEDFLSGQYKAGSNQIKKEEKQLKVINDTIEQNKRRIIELNKQLENLKNGYDETSDSTESTDKQKPDVSTENVKNDTQQINENTSAIIANTNARKENEEQTRKQYTAEEALDTISERFSAKDYYKDVTANKEAIQEEAKFFQGVTQSRPKLLKEMNAEVKDLNKEIKPVDEMIKRIKEGSSIEGIGKDSFLSEAMKLDDIIGKTNDGKHMEEYVTAMLKINNLINAQMKAMGGVKGTGTKNKVELRDMIIKQWAEASAEMAKEAEKNGTDFKSVDFSRTIQALFGDKRLSLFDGKNIKSMDQLAGMVLGDDLRTDKFDRISDVRERLSALKDAVKFMKSFMKEIQNVESQATSESGGEDGLSGYWNVKIRSMEAGIQSYQDKLKTDGDNLVKTIMEESKAVEEAERQFSEATAFMLDNSDVSTGGTSAGSNSKSQSTVDLLAKQALERANKESINIQRDAERMANKGVSNAEQYKTDALERGRQAIHQAIQDVIDEEIGQAFDYYIGNMDISESTKAKVSRKDADKAAEEALIKANKDGIAKQKKMYEQQAKQMAGAVDYYMKNTEAIGATDVKSVVGDADKSVEEALQKANEEAIRKQIEKLEKQQVDAINYYVEQTEAIGSTDVKSIVGDADKAVEDALEKANETAIKAAVKKQEADIKAIEKGYGSLAKRATTNQVYAAKDNATPKERESMDRYTADLEETEKLYREYAQKAGLSADIIKRIQEARQQWVEAVKNAINNTDEYQIQKDAEAAAKLAEQNTKREAQAELTANRKTISSVKKDVRDAEKYLGSMEGSKLFDTDEGIKFGEQLANIKSILDSIGNVDIINNNDSEEIARIREEADKLKITLSQAKESGSDLVDVSGSDKAVNTLANINKLMQNGNVSNEQFLELSRYKELLEGKNINTSQLDAIANSYSKINSEVKKGSTVIDAIQGKFKSLVGYMLSFASFYRIIGTVKQMATTVREFDDAFTEMRKVSDESVETLKAYQKESYDMASSIGTDALSLQKSTADFLRLGQSLEEAKDSARSANILMNVSEFSSIDQATESLIAMKAAYQDLGNMDIIDKLNKVGNDFSISTDKLATALQASAASLVNAGNDMDQAVALITAGNAVVQDASKVGAGLRTIALRIRGTKEAKQELEEMGEETETFIETQSKLRETILNATKVKSNNYMGFDILKDNGSYKSTYEIMLGISKVYKEILEQDEKTGGKQGALLLETLAGKTRSNIAASILSNGEMLEKAYNESAFESVNSAIIENEKYLDSLSGHLAQLKTAWQELQTTMMDSSFLKGLTDLGTGTLKGANGIFSQLSPTSLLMTIMGGVAGINGLSPIQFDRYGKLKPMFGASNKDTKAFVSSIKNQLGKMKPQDWDIAGFGEEGIQVDVYAKMKDVDIEELEKQFNKIDPSVLNIAKEMHENGGSIEDFTKRIEDNKAAWSQLKSVAASTITSMIASFGISLGVDFIQKFIDAPKAIAAAASAAGNTIKNETKSINEYKDKVQELWDVINDPNSSIEAQANARQELLNIQNELIANYGNEASLLTGVSASADAAANSFEKLAEAQYRANMLAFKEGEGNGVIKNAANAMSNFFSGYTGKDANVERMIDQMENLSVSRTFANTGLKDAYELQDTLKKIFARNNIEFNEKAFNESYGREFKLTGSARDLAEAVKEAQTTLEHFKYTIDDATYKDASNAFQSMASNISDVVTKYGDLYDSQIYYEKILGDSTHGYEDYYNNLKKYYEDYKEAFSSGNSEATKKAVENFTREFDSALAEAGTDEKNGKAIAGYLKNMYSSAKSVMGGFSFEEDFKKNIDGVKSSVQGYLDTLKGYSTEDLLNFVNVDADGEASKAWNSLEQLANDYGMTIEQLIPKLEEMGLVQSQSYYDLLNNFKDYQYQISNMSQEELQIAYRIYAEGMTFEELHDRIEQEKGLIEIGFDINDRSGLDEYNNIKSNSKSKHADYDQYRQMLETGKELAKQGRIGEEEFKKIAELFSENGMTDLGNWKENVANLGKYFTEDSKGAQQLVKDMSNLKDSGGNAFAKLNDDGKTWTLNLENMGELAEKLHMPMELLQVLLQNLQSFGFTDDYFGNMETGTEHLTQLYKELADEETKLAQMRAENKPEDLIKDQEAVVQGIKDSIETTREGINNLISDAEKGKESTENVYNAQRSAVENLINEYNRLKESGASSYELDSVKEALESISKEYSIPIKFEADKASIDDSLKLAEEKVQQKKEELRLAKTKVEIDPSEVENLEKELDEAIKEKQILEQPAIMKIETEGIEDTGVKEAAETLQDFQSTYDEVDRLVQEKELGIKVDEKQLAQLEVRLAWLSKKLQGMKEDAAKIGVDTSSGNSASIEPQLKGQSKEGIEKSLSNLEGTATVNLNDAAFNSTFSAVMKKIKNLNKEKANVPVNITGSALSQLREIARVLASLHDKTIKVTTHKQEVTSKTTGAQKVNGTAHASGTAFLSGTHTDWRTKEDGEALGGELGQEIMVTPDGKWQMIGENGAEFFKYKKNSIIFNAAQTEELLKYGKIKNAKRRGKALVNGTAFLNGSAGAGGSVGGFVVEEETNTTNTKKTIKSSSGKNKDKSGGKKKKKSSKKSSKKSKSKSSSTPEIFDWLELKIETIEREIKKLDITAQSVFKSWTTRSTKLEEEISKVTEEIDRQNDAVKRYGKDTTDADVKATYKKFKVDYKKTKKRSSKKAKKLNKKNRRRNDKLAKYQKIIDEGGKVDVSTIKDDKLAEKVKNYQEWITKSREAEVAVDELREKLAELNAQKFDNLKKQFDEALSDIEHKANMLEENLDANKYLGSVKNISDNSIVNSQIKNETDNYNKLKKEYNDLKAKREELTAKNENDLKNGLISKDSEKWKEWEKELQDIELKEEQSLNKLRDLQKQKFENIKSSFETQISDIQKSANFINESLNQVQQRGFLASKQFYKDLMANEQNQMKLLEKERNQLIAQTNAAIKAGTLKVGSEEWYAQQEAISEVSLALEQGNTQLIEYANNIRDIDWQVFDMIRDEVNDTINESEFLIDLLSNKDLFEDNGQFTKQGMATLGSRSVNYNLQMAQADAYRDEMLKIQEELNKAENKGNKTLIDRKKELLKLQQDSIKNAEQEKEAIKSLVKEGIEKELESLKKLIDKQTELLDKEKSQYDYQKRIKDQTKDISSLEKQLAALSGDDSEAARSKRQKLEAQLKEAKDTLQETTYDQYVSDQKDMLDDLYDQYDEVLNKRLDNVDALIADMIKTTNENAANIKTTLEKESTKVGYKITTDLTNIWAEGGKDKDVVKTYSDNLGTKVSSSVSTAATTIGNYINGLKTKVESEFSFIRSEYAKDDNKRKQQAEAIANAIAKVVKPTTDSKTDDSKDDSKKDEQKPNKQEPAKSSGNKVVNTVTNGKYKATLTLVDTSNKKYKEESTFEKDKKKFSQSFKKAAIGVHKVPKDDDYWTQEFGSEAIIRPSDGAILTPLKSGDSVLSKTATDNLWKAANDPSKFIRDNIMGGLLSSIDSSANSNYVQNIDNITFNMPNVKNYEQLISQMQSDKNFEKLILSMSVDRLAGGSSLGKYKALR